MPDRPSTSDYQRCGAQTRRGKKCAQRAGARTEHEGAGRCWLHGGNSPSGVKSAAKQKALAEGRRYITEVDVDPLQAMLSAVRLAAGIRAAALERVGEIDAQADPDAYDYASRMLRQTNRELWQASKATIDAGVAERYVRMAERVGGALSAAIEAGLAVAAEAFGDALTPELRQAIVTAQLGRLESFEVEGEDITDRKELAA